MSQNVLGLSEKAEREREKDRRFLMILTHMRVDDSDNTHHHLVSFCPQSSR